MICPHCKEEITEVRTYFEFYQKIDIKTQIVIDSDTIFDEMTDAECGNCNKSIKDDLDQETFEILMEA